MPGTRHEVAKLNLLCAIRDPHGEQGLGAKRTTPCSPIYPSHPTRKPGLRDADIATPLTGGELYSQTLGITLGLVVGETELSQQLRNTFDTVGQHHRYVLNPLATQRGFSEQSRP